MRLRLRRAGLANKANAFDPDKEEQMDYIQIDGGRGSRQAKPRRQWYPRWGMEEPSREWTGWSLYRHGTKSLLDRYLITPKPTALLDKGLTVLDLAIAVAVAAFMLLLGQQFGIAFDSYADMMGW